MNWINQFILTGLSKNMKEITLVIYIDYYAISKSIFDTIGILNVVVVNLDLLTWQKTMGCNHEVTIHWGFKYLFCVGAN